MRIVIIGLMIFVYACEKSPTLNTPLLNDNVIEILADKISGIPPLAVSFEPVITHGINCDFEYLWQFGDGTVSTEKKPVHIFQNSGTYEVVLDVINSDDISQKIVMEKSIVVEDFRWKIYNPSHSYQNVNLDSAGVPIVDYGDKGMHYNPVTSSQYALGAYNLFIENRDSTYYNRFFTIADWLLNWAELKDDSTAWLPYYFYYKHVKNIMGDHWVSGMAQGEALSVLSRAYFLSNDIKYLNMAKKVFNSFLVKESYNTQWWVTFIDENQYVWIEEYPSRNLTCHVLNGYIFGTGGIYDYFYISNDENALVLFTNLIRTLESNLDFYDTGDWSFYCKHEILVSDSYQKIHANQLNFLYLLTGIETFRLYSNLFFSYMN